MATKLRDGRWKATHLLPSGKRKSWTGPTEEIAESLKAAYLREDDRGPTPSADLDLHTLAGLLWYPRIEGNRPNTVRRYRDAYRLHVRPEFGARKPGEIRPADVQRWVNALAAQGVSPASIQLYKGILSTVLKLCHAEGLCASNAASVAKMPKVQRRIRTMSLADLRGLLARVEGTELAAPVFLAAVLGLSRGEACGLKWSRVERERRRVSIAEQRLVRQGERGASVAEGPLKRGSRERSFVLPPALFEALERVGNLDAAYVCTRANGRPWNPEHLTGEWSAIRQELGFPHWAFHDLRHGAAGVLVALGVDLLTVAAILGHASINTTELYAAAQEATATKGLERVADALFGPREP